MSHTDETPLALEQAVLDDPATSDWLKQQIKASHERDIVDAIADAKMLTRLLKRRFLIMTNSDT